MLLIFISFHVSLTAFHSTLPIQRLFAILHQNDVSGYFSRLLTQHFCHKRQKYIAFFFEANHGPYHLIAIMPEMFSSG